VFEGTILNISTVFTLY